MIDAITLLRAEEVGLPAAESHPDAPYVCFPMRLEWEVATGRKVEAAPFPAPLVTSEQTTDQKPPAPVAGLHRVAQELGWDVRLTYALGYVPHATHGRPGEEPKESWVVRMQRAGCSAVAVRTDGSWTSLWTWSADTFFTRHRTLDAFTDAVLGRLVTFPSRKDWDALLVCYPSKAEWLKVRRG